MANFLEVVASVMEKYGLKWPLAPSCLLQPPGRKPSALARLKRVGVRFWTGVHRGRTTGGYSLSGLRGAPQGLMSAFGSGNFSVPTPIG